MVVPEDTRRSASNSEASMPVDFLLGESLVGDGNEVAHIDLIKVMIKGAKQAVQMFGPAQAANLQGEDRGSAVTSPSAQHPTESVRGPVLAGKQGYQTAFAARAVDADTVAARAADEPTMWRTG
jgi:hypothetical protein